MMNKRLSTLFSAGLAVLLCCALTTASEFSADLVDAENGEVVQKMYVSGQKLRFDALLGEDGTGPSAVSIIRLDTGKHYVLLPDTKTYMEIAFDKNVATFEDFNKTMLPEGTLVTRESMGKETIDGREAEKFKVTSTVDLMGEQVTMVNYEWMSPDVDPLPLRFQDTEDDSTFDLRNIAAGPQDASLFEVPGDYNRDAGMEALMMEAQN